MKHSARRFFAALLVAAVGWHDSQALGQEPGPRGPANVSSAVADAAAANEAVEALVLLDDSDESAFEQSVASSNAPLHLAPPAGYLQRMADRQALLSQLKTKVLADVGGSDMDVLTDYSVLPILHVRVRSPVALARLAGHGKVLSIDEDRVNYPMLAESLPLIQQPTAAATGHRGAGTTIAVLDTGVDYTRAAFGSCSAPGGSCKVVYAQDFAPDDGAPDSHGHGTNVAGIALGVALDAKIAALDVFGSSGTASSSDIISAINWCISQKATYNIASINMSLGAGRYFSAVAPTDSWGTAIQGAVNSGITVVAAAGNDAFADSISLPAAYSNVVSVGAVYDANVGSRSYFRSNGTVLCTDSSTSADKVTCFSNSASFLSLLAPGALISAAGIQMAGTSQAAPHAAGAAAVLRATYPTDPVSALANRLKQGPLVADGKNGISRPRLDLVQAVGAVGTQTLAVSKTGTGSGSVTSSPAGIDCGSTCSASFATGTGVTLAASPSAGSTFVGWSGACAGVGPCVVTMSAARSVNATFDSSPAESLLVNGQSITGLGGAMGSSQYFYIDVPAGASNLLIQTSGGSGDADLYIRFGALPTTGVFDCSSTSRGGGESCSIAFPSAGRYYVLLFGFAAYGGLSLQPYFAQDAKLMTVSKIGSGSGSVTSNPAGIACGAACSAAFPAGTSVTLVASAAAGSIFGGWSGACMGTGNCTLAMSEDRSVTARFRVIPGPSMIQKLLLLLLDDD